MRTVKSFKANAPQNDNAASRPRAPPSLAQAPLSFVPAVVTKPSALPPSVTHSSPLTLPPSLTKSLGIEIPANTTSVSNNSPTIITPSTPPPQLPPRPLASSPSSSGLLISSHRDISSIEQSPTEPTSVPTAALQSPYVTTTTLIEKSPNDSPASSSRSITSSTSSKNITANDADYEIYTVSRSDTLIGIAIKWDMSVEELRKLNKLFHSSSLMPGQALKVKKRPPAPRPLFSFKQPAPVVMVAKHHLLGTSMPNLPVTETLIPVSRLIREMMIPQSALEIITTSAEYVVDANPIPVHGVLTVTPTRIIYEPDLDDAQVIRHGVVPYTFSIDVNKLTECNEVPAKTGWELVLQIEWRTASGNGHAFFVVSKQKCNAIYRKLLEQIPELKENAIIGKFNLDTPHPKPDVKPAKPKSSKSSNKAQHKEQKQEEKKVILTVSENLEEEDEEFKPVMKEPSILFGQEEFEKLRKKLPGYNKFADWELLYSTQKHGISWSSFQTKTKGRYPSLIFIEDSHGYVFGGFATEIWTIRPGYFGTGQSFLFSIKPHFKIYDWTRANNFFMCMEKSYLCMGGGHSGGHGFWIDNNFEYGGSSTCDTFLNKCLASSEEFECTVVEVWGFVS